MTPSLIKSIWFSGENLLILFLYTIFISGYTALQQSQTLISVQLPSEKISNEDGDDAFLKLVKGITSKGFVRSNYEEKLVDLSDEKINLKGKK